MLQIRTKKNPREIVIVKDRICDEKAFTLYAQQAY